LALRGCARTQALPLPRSGTADHRRRRPPASDRADRSTAAGPA
jgi:hypothetical protein